ncbi:membrane protein [Legionella beliardensis]|uniref:Membrane protein n=1 Tax=Legionella beliardensis TaxID=91822 RepID=A0A378IAV3_9GAMM|nr:ElyC/SanA/YdcF family protein [Legionella beliardensis]STX29444.1 membrane protein [Legionella beliardensis]
MFAARHLLETMFNPFFLTLLLFAIILIVFYKKKTERRIFYGCLTVFCLLLLFSTGWLPQLTVKCLENQYPIINKPDPNVKWVVVLSGGQTPYANRPANMLLYSASLKRLIEGVRLYRQLPQAKLMLSGGGYGQDASEAQRMADVVTFLGVPADKILLEKSSINTAAQAKLLKKYLKNEPFYLVTSATHMPRSMYLFKQQGLNPIAAPTDFTIYWDNEYQRKVYLPSPQNLVYLTVAWHEILGLLWQKMHVL